jgi:tRNA dimethylallyltransferase
MNKAFVILGPTSSGKTSLAIELCKKYGGEIISVDSRQIYKHMDIGTGKAPTTAAFEIKKEDGSWIMDGIKIWGYDLVDPNQYFSAYDFALFAIEKIKDIISRGKIPFLVGGTGFYFNVITGEVELDKTPPDFSLREELEELSPEDLKQKLVKENPALAEKTDLNNPARMIRAIEKTVSDKEREPIRLPKNIEYIKIGLTAPRKYLYERVDAWVEDIWENGLIEETRRLMSSEYKESQKLNGLVYKTAVKYVNHKLDEEKAKQKIKHNLHAYIRRQQTYFKKIPDVTWIDITQDNKLEKLYNIVDG